MLDSDWVGHYGGQAGPTVSFLLLFKKIEDTGSFFSQPEGSVLTIVLEPIRKILNRLTFTYFKFISMKLSFPRIPIYHPANFYFHSWAFHFFCTVPGSYEIEVFWMEYWCREVKSFLGSFRGR